MECKKTTTIKKHHVHSIFGSKHRACHFSKEKEGEKVRKRALRVRRARYFAQGASRTYGIPNILFRVLWFFVFALSPLTLKALPENKKQTTAPVPKLFTPKTLKSQLFSFCNSFSQENNITDSSVLLATGPTLLCPGQRRENQSPRWTGHGQSPQPTVDGWTLADGNLPIRAHASQRASPLEFNAMQSPFWNF